MSSHLDETLNAIGSDYGRNISPSSRFYVEVDIGQKGRQLGYSDVHAKYEKVLVVVPVKEAQRGMKVRIDGRTFVKYGQLASGVAVPGYVLRHSRLAYTAYKPNDSMILNFT